MKRIKEENDMIKKNNDTQMKLFDEQMENNRIEFEKTLEKNKEFHQNQLNSMNQKFNREYKKIEDEIKENSENMKRKWN